MRLALHSGTSAQGDLWEDLELARAAGFDLIELAVEKLDRAVAERGIEAVRSALGTAGLGAWTIDGLESISFRDADGEARLTERCRQLCDYARRLGCPHVVARPGWSPAGAKLADVVHETARVLSDLSTVAGRQVNIALEVASSRGGSTFAGAAAAVAFCSRVNIGLVLDCFHFFASGSGLEDLAPVPPNKINVLRLSDAPDRPHAELHDSMRLLPGDGILPLQETLGALRQMGYNSMASIALPQLEAGGRTALELARAGRERLIELLRGAGLRPPAFGPAR